MENPKVTLVGAGPGSADLITLRGLKALQEAQVVIYDALVGAELLDWAENAVEKVYVGKRACQHSFTQDEINGLLAQYALRYGSVVRLKGGDPYVFGRGQEEIEFLQRRGIQTELIPGISSALAVPALQGVPLTHRGLSESFWVITGTTKDGKISKDIYEAAKTLTTTVILMGLSHLAEIVQIYKTLGKGELPVAVIQNGSLDNERAVVGHIEDIEHQVHVANIGAPAIILIGEVVSFHKTYAALTRKHELFSFN